MGDLQEFDEVTLSGYCGSEGRFFYHLAGCIGTVEPTQIKLWPEDPSVGDGKLWFDLRTLRIHKHYRVRYVLLQELAGWSYFEQR